MASSSSFLSFLSPLFPSNHPPKPLQLPPSPSPISSSQSHQSLPLQSEQLTRPTITPVIGEGEVMSVVWPAVAYANTMYFRSGYNVQVVVEENEPEERLLNRFRREVMKAGVIQECKRRRFFENKQEEKKRKTREAAKRNSRRRRPQMRGPSQGKVEENKAQKKVEEEDNWELPEGEDIPF